MKSIIASIMAIAVLMPAITFSGLAMATTEIAKTDPSAIKKILDLHLAVMKPAYTCPAVPTTLWGRYLANLQKALSRPNSRSPYSLGVKTKPARNPNCKLTHYTKFTKFQQEVLVQACFEHRYFEVDLPQFYSCNGIYNIDLAQDKVLPEFVEMRKHYSKLVAELQAKKEAYAELEKKCYVALINGASIDQDCDQVFA